MSNILKSIIGIATMVAGLFIVFSILYLLGAYISPLLDIDKVIEIGGKEKADVFIANTLRGMITVIVGLVLLWALVIFYNGGLDAYNKIYGKLKK